MSPLYEPLESSRDEIRLMTILPSEHDDEPVICLLETVTLLEAVDFAAMSYVWGDPKATESIVVNRIPFKITANLKDALWHFRKLDALRRGSGDERLRLWADAICVDQTNLDERSQQVTLMRQIYKRASRVLYWLGVPGEHQLDLPLRFARSFFECLPFSSGQRIWNLDHGNQNTMRELGLQWLVQQPDFWTQDGPEPYKNTFWNALQEFKLLPFWERVWIVQELVLPPEEANQTCICGTTMVSLVDLFLFLDFLAFLPRATITPPGWRPTAWAVLCGSPLFNNDQLSDVARLRSFDNDPDPYLFLLMSATLKATDPRDLVYGMLGLLETGLRPDYTKSTKDVYKDWFSLFLNEPTGRMAFVLPQGIPIYAASIGCREQNDPSWPTWLPNLSLFKGGELGVLVGDTRPVRLQARLFNLLDGFQIKPPEILQSDVLSVYGVACTEVSEVVPVRENGEGDATAQLIRLCLNCANKTELKDHPAGIPRLQALFRSLYQDYEPQTTEPLPFPLEPSSTIAGCFRYTFLSLAPRAVLGDEFDVNDVNVKRLLNFLDQQYRDCSDPEANGRWMDDFRRWAHRDFMLQYKVDCIKSWDEGFDAVFYTPDGYVGCGPRWMLPGDRVCLLDKCSLPAILRKKDGGWLHVGTCYVYGLSDGQPVDRIKSGELKVEEFRIY